MISRKLDFEVLLSKEPALYKYWNNEGKKFDFTNHDALIKLTETLIKQDLGYSVKLMDHQLCPNYFNRLDYILFIKRLINLTLISTNDYDYRVLGLDIGTSQSCIYPLLATKYIPNLCKMVATDIIPEFILSAKSNVETNNLSSIIEPILVDPKENSFIPLIDNIKSSFEKLIVFSLCNPPFYSSKDEIVFKRKKKINFNKNEIIGHTSELITDGGDYKFIIKLLKDSENIEINYMTWFTSLIGNYSTLKKLIQYMKQNRDKFSFGIHRFKSGSFTVRWILFWTFKKEFKPPPELFNYHDNNISNKQFIKKLNLKNTHPMLIKSLLLKKLTKLPYILLTIRDKITIYLPGNVFSRSYRRSKTFTNDGSIYVFEISFYDGHVIWRHGLDYKLFESFSSFINTTI